MRDKDFTFNKPHSALIHFNDSEIVKLNLGESENAGVLIDEIAGTESDLFSGGSSGVTPTISLTINTNTALIGPSSLFKYENGRLVYVYIRQDANTEQTYQLVAVSDLVDDTIFAGIDLTNVFVGVGDFLNVTASNEVNCEFWVDSGECGVQVTNPNEDASITLVVTTV